MKIRRLVIFVAMACMLTVLAGQTAFAAIRIVKFNVPSCE